MQNMDQGKVPSYTKKSIKEYQHRNKRVKLFIDSNLYQKFIEHYEGMSFNAYVKTLMDKALETEGTVEELFGQLPYSAVLDSCIEKNCVFSKEYEQNIIDKYIACAGQQALVRRGKGQGKGFSFIAYLQWLIARDLEKF